MDVEGEGHRTQLSVVSRQLSVQMKLVANSKNYLFSLLTTEC